MDMSQFAFMAPSTGKHAVKSGSVPAAQEEGAAPQDASGAFSKSYDAAQGAMSGYETSGTGVLTPEMADVDRGPDGTTLPGFDAPDESKAARSLRPDVSKDPIALGDGPSATNKNEDTVIPMPARERPVEIGATKPVTDLRQSNDADKPKTNERARDGLERAASGTAQPARDAVQPKVSAELATNIAPRGEQPDIVERGAMQPRSWMVVEGTGVDGTDLPKRIPIADNNERTGTKDGEMVARASNVPGAIVSGARGAERLPGGAPQAHANGRPDESVLRAEGSATADPATAKTVQPEALPVHSDMGQPKHTEAVRPGDQRREVSIREERRLDLAGTEGDTSAEAKSPPADTQRPGHRTGAHIALPAAVVPAAEAMSFTAESDLPVQLWDMAAVDAPRRNAATAPTLDIAALSRPEAARPIITQVADVVRTASDGRVEVTLRPEELGRLSLSFTNDGVTMTVALSAERPETLELIRRNLDIPAQDLSDLGFGSLNFDFTEGAQEEPGGEARQRRNSGSVDDNAETAPGAVTASSITARVAAGGMDLRL